MLKTEMRLAVRYLEGAFDGLVQEFWGAFMIFADDVVVV